MVEEGNGPPAQRPEQPAPEPSQPAPDPSQPAAVPPAAPMPAPPPPEAWQRPVRVEPVPGTPYGLAILGGPEATSGAAVGALVSGVAALVVALVVACLGVGGASAGWGLWVAGAFAALASFLGAAGVGLGLVGMRQVRRPPPAPPGGHPSWALPAPGIGQPGQPPPAGSGAVRPVRGRGMAVAGVACGASALVVVACALAGTAAIQLT